MKITFSAAIMSALFIPAIPSAGETPELPDHYDQITDWSSALTGGVDLGWKGTWVLKSALVRTPQGTLRFPSAGHTLTIDYLGHYNFSYSSAHFLGSDPGVVPYSCIDTGQFSGHVSGQMFAPYDLDLDRLNSDGLPIYGLPWMEVKLNPSASSKPRVKCKGAEIKVKSTGTVLPLGAGRRITSEHGKVVAYDYEMDPDLTTLTIRGRGMPRITYVFVKPN